MPHQSAVLYWTVAAAGSVLFVAALAAHEIAPAIVARHWGVQVRSVTLWMLGGIAELEGEPPTARAYLQIAIAGPAASLAAGTVFGGAAALARSVHSPAVVTAALAWLAVMNVVLAVFNLLPGAPLDGGRILRGLLWKRYGDRQRASRAAARSGQAVGIGMGVIGLLWQVVSRDVIDGLWLMLIGWFVDTMARAERSKPPLPLVLPSSRSASVNSSARQPVPPPRRDPQPGRTFGPGARRLTVRASSCGQWEDTGDASSGG